MKRGKSIFSILFFCRNVEYETYLTKEELLSGLRKFSKSKNLDGKLFSDSFEFLYTSDFALASLVKLPVTEFKGTIYQNTSGTSIAAKIYITILEKFIFFFASGSIILVWIIDRLSNGGFGGISETFYPLLVFPSYYILLLVKFLFGSESNKEYFGSVIKRIEKTIANNNLPK